MMQATEIYFWRWSQIGSLVKGCFSFSADELVLSGLESLGMYREGLRACADVGISWLTFWGYNIKRYIYIYIPSHRKQRKLNLGILLHFLMQSSWGCGFTCFSPGFQNSVSRDDWECPEFTRMPCVCSFQKCLKVPYYILISTLKANLLPWNVNMGLKNDSSLSNLGCVLDTPLAFRNP